MLAKVARILASLAERRAASKEQVSALWYAGSFRHRFFIVTPLKYPNLTDFVYNIARKKNIRARTPRVIFKCLNSVGVLALKYEFFIYDSYSSIPRPTCRKCCRKLKPETKAFLAIIICWAELTRG